MKHEKKITALLLAMFLSTQLIGLIVIDAYSPKISEQIVNGTIQNVTISNELPYGMQPPEMEPQFSFMNIIVSLAIAIVVFFLLMKVRARSLIKLWFTFVVLLTMSIALTALLSKIFPYSNIRLDTIALLLAVPLTYLKIFKRNMIAHNATELLIYPGLAAVFVPILSVWTSIILLLVISAYDIYAVWKSSIMVNLAKYQINHLKVFTGFFLPYLRKKDAKAFSIAQKITNKKERLKRMRKIKVSLAILGGGDVAFPLIFSGVIYRTAGLMPALCIVVGSTIALLGLFLFSKKGKFYPAMPFITAGCLLGWMVSLII